MCEVVHVVLELGGDGDDAFSLDLTPLSVGGMGALVAGCEVVQEGAEDHQLTREVPRHIQHHGVRHQGQGDASAAGHRHARLVITPDLQFHLKIRSDVKYKLFNFTQFHTTNIKQL